MKNVAIIFVASLILSSCSFYQVRSQDDSGFSLAEPKKSFMDVEYVSETKKPHQVIGTLRVNTERNRGMEDVIRKMKMEAAVLGGDAVTEVMPDPEAAKKKESNARMRVDYVGKVIVYQ